MHSIARFLGTLVCLQLATAAAIAKPGLEKLKGEWASDPSRCNQPVERDDDLRLHVEGTEFSFGETVCKVVDVKQPQSDTFLVQAACSSEGEPGLFSYQFRLKSGSLAVSNGDWKWTFSGCKPKQAAKKDPPYFVPRKPATLSKYCYRAGCDFTKIVSTQVIEQSSDHRLLRIETTSASVEVPTDQFDQVKMPRQFPTETDINTVVNCSKSAPFVANFNPQGPNWYVVFVNIPDEVSKYNSSPPQLLYWAACHEINAFDLPETALKKFGYRQAWPNYSVGRKFPSINHVQEFARDLARQASIFRRLDQEQKQEGQKKVETGKPMRHCYAVEGVPAGDKLNIRSRPSTKSPVIARLKNGDLVAYEGKERRVGLSTWIFINYDIDEPIAKGWVNDRFLRPADWHACDSNQQDAAQETANHPEKTEMNPAPALSKPPSLAVPENFKPTELIAPPIASEEVALNSTAFNGLRLGQSLDEISRLPNVAELKAGDGLPQVIFLDFGEVRQNTFEIQPPAGSPCASVVVNSQKRVVRLAMLSCWFNAEKMEPVEFAQKIIDAYDLPSAEPGRNAMSAFWSGTTVHGEKVTIYDPSKVVFVEPGTPGTFE